MAARNAFSTWEDSFGKIYASLRTLNGKIDESQPVKNQTGIGEPAPELPVPIEEGRPVLLLPSQLRF